MRTSAARILREDDQQDMSREAVLLQWERKIEAAERRPGRFEREEDSDEGAVVAELRSPSPASEDSTHEGAQRFEQAPAAEAPAERRTITITGQPTPARRRRSVVDVRIAQPDTLALWAFLLGLFLVVVAAGTAHA